MLYTRVIQGARKSNKLSRAQGNRHIGFSAWAQHLTKRCRSAGHACKGAAALAQDSHAVKWRARRSAQSLRLAKLKSRAALTKLVRARLQNPIALSLSDSLRLVGSVGSPSTSSLLPPSSAPAVLRMTRAAARCRRCRRRSYSRATLQGRICGGPMHGLRRGPCSQLQQEPAGAGRGQQGPAAAGPSCSKSSSRSWSEQGPQPTRGPGSRCRAAVGAPRSTWTCGWRQPRQ